MEATSISIGVTGGIGSGKSSILKHFEAKGVPVYYADDRAKAMVYVPTIKKEIMALLGEDSYLSDGTYNTAFIRNQVFEHEEKRMQLNSIIHHAVKEDYTSWKKQQKAPYIFKEAAILFESGSYQDNDYNILISAPEHLRIERVQKRSQLEAAAIHKIINAQWSDKKKIPLADFVIENIELPKAIECLEKWLKEHIS